MNSGPIQKTCPPEWAPAVQEHLKAKGVVEGHELQAEYKAGQEADSRSGNQPGECAYQLAHNNANNNCDRKSGQEPKPGRSADHVRRALRCELILFRTKIDEDTGQR